MRRNRADNEPGRWSADGNPVAIEYLPPAMEGIRAAVVEGFYRIGRGGIEVGGVLFGAREGKRTCIQAFRPLECGYATGPSFVLSDKDRQALSRLLDESTRDPELKGMRPVGWYHSHTRSELFLSEEDHAIYDLYFPEPWQVALVLRPERMKPVRAGFFVREPDGSVRKESSYKEFVVEPLSKQRASANGAEATQQESGPVEEAAGIGGRRTYLWLDWLLFTAALFLLLTGIFLAARPIIPPGILPAYLAPRPAVSQETEANGRRIDELSRQLIDLRGQSERQSERIRQLETTVEDLQARVPKRAAPPGRRSTAPR